MTLLLPWLYAMMIEGCEYASAAAQVPWKTALQQAIAIRPNAISANSIEMKDLTFCLIPSQFLTSNLMLLVIFLRRYEIPMPERTQQAGPETSIRRIMTEAK